MISCRVNKVLPLLLSAGLAVSALPAGAEPQPAHEAPAAGAPMPLLSEPPAPIVIESEQHKAVEKERPRPAGRAVSGVEVQELKAPDANAVGVLDDKHGGFGVDMWQGTSMATVRRLLPQLPVAIQSPSVHGLMRRLLLTAAGVPQGNGADGPSLLQLRAQALWAMGDADGVAALLKAAPDSLRTPELNQLKVDALLLSGDTAGACREAGPAAEPRLQILCHMVSGRTLEGNLALDLMRERKDADKAFIAAAEVLGGLAPVKVDRLPNAQPVHLAAFKAAKMALPADVANAANPAVLRAVAASEAPIEVRIAAAEKAEAMGALDTEALRQLYGSVAFTPADLQSPLAPAAGDKGARTRALMFRAAQSELKPQARAEIVTRAFELAASRGTYGTAARLYAPLLAELRPDGVPPAFGPVAARALFAAGQADAAARWMALAASAPEEAKAYAALWPLARLSRGESDKPTPAAVFDAWRTARELPPDQAERRTAVVLGVLAAVGERVPAAEWLTALDGPLYTAGQPQPRAALKALLRAAVDGLQLGETVLVSAVSLGDAGLDKADPDTIARVVAALHLLGLDKEARALAIEAAVANGV
ncbi:MAG: antifreeze protein [Actinomycetota bacterium]